MRKHLRIFAITLAALLAFASTAEAKTTYIPTYYSQIDITGTTAVADSSFCPEFTVFSEGEKYAVTVLHDLVTEERVKAIKHMKASAGWAIVGAALSGVSAGLNPMRTSWDAVRYVNDMQNIASSSMLHISAKNAADDMQKVPITIMIENLSDDEMQVSDMTRGLVWFVPARSHIRLEAGNPEVNRFRIAFPGGFSQLKDYVTVQTANVLSKENVKYEDDEVWAWSAVRYWEKNRFNVEQYIIRDKKTFAQTILTPDEYKRFVKERKRQGK